MVDEEKDQAEQADEEEPQLQNAPVSEGITEPLAEAGDDNEGADRRATIVQPGGEVVSEGEAPTA